MLFIPKNGSDWGYQKPWTIRGASNKTWSKNTAELSGVSDRAAFYYKRKTYSGCLTLGWADISIDDEACAGERGEEEVAMKDGSKPIT